MDQPDHLESLYQAALKELESARLGLAEAQRRSSDAETRVRLLEGLLSLTLPHGYAHEDTSSSDLIDSVTAILKANGAPMSTSAIRKELLDQGVPLPGKGETANLISHFQRSKGRIIRVSRGLYDIRVPDADS